MKIQVTHLKAPWPEGTNVGDVIDVGDGSKVPAAFVGKFKVIDEGQPAAPAAAEQANPEELAIARNLQKAAEDEAAELRVRIDAVTAERDKAANDLAAVTAERDRMVGEQQAASAATKGKK